jgi:hypothetical protein
MSYRYNAGNIFYARRRKIIAADQPATTLEVTCPPWHWQLTWQKRKGQMNAKIRGWVAGQVN